MLLVLLTCLVILSGVSYLVAIYYNHTTWRMILKPATMVFIIGIFLFNFPNELTGWFLIMGLIFSIIGDIYLLHEHRFLQGLISFFIAHVLYIISFATIGLNLNFATLLVAICLLIVAFIYYRLLYTHVFKQGGFSLAIAVALYVMVISTMLWEAIATEIPLLIIGASLFYLSDAILAWNKFRTKLTWGEYGVMITYYAAQYLIALSILLHKG